MRPDQENPAVITVFGQRPFVFSFLMQRLSANSITSKPTLTIIQRAPDKEQALAEATQLVLAENPGFIVADWVCVELKTPLSNL